MRDQVSSLHANLAALPFRLIVTSNHDPLMETALRLANKTPAVEFYHYRGQNKTLLPVPTVNEPLLFHLYGHISDASSIVLAETQLLDFLTALISKAPPLPADLNAALTNGKMFLFLGFGLHQWYLRILLHVLKVLRRGPPTFAVEIQPRDTGAPLEDAVFFYRENYRTEVYVTDVFDFVSELRQRCAPPPATVADAVRTAPHAAEIATPSARGPKIFICHASEDKDTARNIHETLERSGFDPWLDKEALRGGDEWDGLIESTIKDVDYVMVLNSQSLTAKTRGASYVNKEIKLALRAAEWRLGKFIIPVCIDTAPLVEPLTSYHAVNLSAPEGMRDLIRAVKKAGAA
jgi:hypothetical protein